ncbi:MAG: hypothetical protein IJH12_09355 [Clostridia bacterium]|nr:hypothetical protein [Clostridia bacterium]
MRKTKSKGIIALTLIVAMLLSLVVSRVSATGETYTITITPSGNYTVAGNWDNQAEKFRDGEFIVGTNNYSGVKNGNDFVGTVSYDEDNGNILIKVPVGTTVKPNYNSGAFSLYNGDTLVGNDTEINGDITLTIRDAEQNPNPGDGQGENEGDSVGGEDDIVIDAKFTNATEMIFINNKAVYDNDNGTASFEGTIEDAGTTDPTKTNKLRFCVPFMANQITEFTINGVVYNKDSEGVVVANNGDEYTITVPGAAKYTITGTGVASQITAHTIIWANVGADKNAEDFDEDMLLEHGAARIIAVYDREGNLVPPEAYIGERSDIYGVDESEGMGWALIEPGYQVVFEFVPEYGYQLTNVSANGFELEPQEETNQYTYIMPETNIHFAAEFKKVDDIVKANADAVTEGSITLGGELDGGTAQLTVNNVELSSDKIKGFEDAAGDYTISNYLDIDLYQVFYKGKDDDSDVWENKIDELDKEATITLKLADGVNIDDIVIVHNVHDGDEYEIIQIESYDASTNTITFKTKSFSNYAIATKGDGKKSKGAKTGDMFILYGAVGAVAIAILAWAEVKKNKKQR